MTIVKKAKVATKRVDESAVHFTFADGTEVLCGIEEVPKHVQMQLMLYGLSQKLGDSYAGSQSIEEAIVTHAGVWGNLKAGIFRAKAAGTGGKWVDGLARETGKSLAECQKVWSELDDEGKKALKRHPGIKAQVLAIDAERARVALEAAQKLAVWQEEPDDGSDLSSLF